MYEAYFSLKEQPFSLSPDPRFIFLTAQHQEALAKCQYTIAKRMGVSAIYGDIGAGKTSLARRLWGQYALDPKTNFALLVHPNYPSPFQLIREIRREYNRVRPLRSIADEIADLRDFLIEEHMKGKTTVLILDEAQKMKPPLFELLRQLLNFETNTEKMLQIVLFGQNELAVKIDRLPELKDRITIFGALTPLQRIDCDALIKYRWRVSGGETPPFDDAALERIFFHTSGLPRKICKICNNALIKAYSIQTKTIGSDIIDQVAVEIRISKEEKSESTLRKTGPKSKKL